MSLFGGVEIVGHPDLDNVRKLDLSILPILRKMHARGVAVDRTYFNDLTSKIELEMEGLKKDIHSYIPQSALDEFVGVTFNIDSPEQISSALFKHLRVGHGKELKLTKSGTRISSGKKQLEELKNDHPIIPRILQYRERAKLVNTYCAKIPKIATYDRDTDTWRVRTRFGVTNTSTGRLNCVSGSTLLPTNRGVFRFDEYQPLIGDTVTSHTGRQCRVLRKIYKGTSAMFRVALSNGFEIQCTQGHRFLTPSGWMYLRDLNIKSGVYSVDIAGFFERSEESKDGGSSICSGGQTDSVHISGSYGNNLPNYALCREEQHERGKVFSGEGYQVFPQQDERKESNDWQEWETPSQLEGRSRELRQGIRSSQERVCGDVRDTDSSIADNLGCTPHRQESTEQSSRQSSIGDYWCSSSVPFQTHEIREITYVGQTGVWDITVEEDQSYIAQGFINHNSAQPINLQNIPYRTDLGKEVRHGFIATPGYKLVSHDYSQIELRVLAHVANEREMIRIFNADGDIHIDTTLRANSLTMDQWLALGTPELRAIGKLSKVQSDMRLPIKAANFLAVYQGTGLALQQTLAISGIKQTEEWCNQFIENWYGLYPDVRPFMDSQTRNAIRYGYTWCLFGRTRLIPQMKSVMRNVQSDGVREAGNVKVQGTAAGIMKLGMAETDCVNERYAQEGIDIHPLMSIHDQLVQECPEDYADPYADHVQYIFEQACPLKVPVKVDYEVTQVWGH